ncbi:MAG: YfhO family protein [Bacteroidales bacterium]|nr:YfhO family protein [Bacteroidales bacterium]
MIDYLKNHWQAIVVAVVLFFVLSSAYLLPTYQGKVIAQHDIKVWQAASKEAKDFKEETGENTFWTNSMFGGMPTYLINNLSDGNGLSFFSKLLTINNFRPVSFIFLYLLGFFIALLAFRVNPWLSIVGAIAFAFSSYFLIIIQAGHITKAIAIGYMAPIIAGVYMAYNKKELWGSILMGLFLSLQILANHLQITYYTFLIVLVFIIIQIVEAIKNQSFRAFFKSSSYLLVAALMAIGSNFLSLSAVYDYGKDSIRGPSELSSEAHNRTSGLDKDYATDWSYGVFESFNLMIPNLMGGASQSDLGTKSETYEALKDLGQPNAKQIVKQMPTYWGDQPFTSGPTYIGALIVFLFILGSIVVKGSLKWWLLTATILSLMLAWGKNMMWFTDLFLEYFPGYNKFRAVSMTLVMAELTIPLLGILGLQRIISGDYDTSKIKKQVLVAGASALGLVVLLILYLKSSDTAFISPSDTQMFGQNDMLLEAIKNDRASLFQSDALRSIFFIALGFASVWLFIQKKIKTTLLIVIIGLGITVDLWTVDKRYLNDDHFERPAKEGQLYQATVADESILKDQDPDYRVLNLTVSTFNDASTSYFHKSIGGYHGAKMRRYQELITYHIAPEIQQFSQILQSQPTNVQVMQALNRLDVLNMLNAKYIIYSPQAPAIPNQFALGHAWFVEEYKTVANADEEIQALDQFDPKTTAIVDQRYQDQLFKFEKDSTANIELLSYAPNALSYRTSTKLDQLAVFSEIYYDKGWMAYIDGEHVSHFRANYVLRAMKIPAGEHTIEFKFEPPLYSRGVVIGMISSILLLLLLIGGFVYDAMKKKKEAQTEQ